MAPPSCVSQIKGLATIENLPVVQCQTGLLDKQVEQLVVVQSQSTAVEPYQEGGLRSYGLDLSQT